MAIIHERVMEFMNKLADLGAKWVEFDIKLTSDLQPVLFHDTSVKPDCSKCPKCGGPADNGNDRCVPPNPYYCSKCTELEADPNIDGELMSLKCEETK